MKRSRFLRNLAGVGLLAFWACDSKTENSEDKTNDLRQELLEAWQRSQKMTMLNVEQMPAEFFTYQYTDEAMSFSEQWRHCVLYTCGQISGRINVNNPYENVKLPVQMTKEHITEELNSMYAFVEKVIKEIPSERLISNCEFAGDQIPIWRLFYAMENHIIHHRGQCIVYLRLKGVVPKGYYGW